MMHPKQVLREAAEITGWDINSQLEVCLDFIAQMNTGEPNFQQYVNKRVDDEMDFEPETRSQLKAIRE